MSKNLGSPAAPPASTEASAETTTSSSVEVSLEFAAESSITPIVKTVRLNTGVDLANLLVSFSCTQVVSMAQISGCIHTSSALSAQSQQDINVSPLRPPKFTAFASIRIGTAGMSKEPRKADFRPLSRPLLAQGRLGLVNLKADYNTQKWDHIADDQRTQAIRSYEARLDSLNAVVEDWVIEETRIYVKCRAFVATMLAACTLLVVRGILVGALVGNRITGVDPFNITSFAWIVAAFVLFVAKSLRVQDWPWTDFFRGWVPCRSISELHTVSGVDEQEIIEYLLSKESSTILNARGPFNKAFKRRTDDGFSIDVKSTSATLIASGSIPLKVATVNGPALVCMDVREGLSGKSVMRHTDSLEEKESIVGCVGRAEIFDEGQEVPLQKIRDGVRGSWQTIIGVYHAPHKRFR